MMHTGDGHEEAFWLKRWSDDHGEIARTSNDVSMFDVFNMNALGYTNRHDYMSYGPNRWSAWDIWHHIEEPKGGYSKWILVFLVFIVAVFFILKVLKRR